MSQRKAQEIVRQLSGVEMISDLQVNELGFALKKGHKKREREKWGIKKAELQHSSRY